MKRNSKLIALLIACAIVICVFSAYTLINYSHGITAMDSQNFIAAQRYFDKIPFADFLFPNECAFIQAGSLMDQGNYLDALTAFQSLDTAVPVSLMDELFEKIYQQAQRDYRNANYTVAKTAFKAIKEYKRSEDYLLLIKSQRTPHQGDYEKLLSILSFEDTKEIILDSHNLLALFLKGTWEGKNGYYFKLTSNQTTYNLPHDYATGYYYLNNGIYSVGETSTEAIDYFKFALIDKDTISVYCYKNKASYELYRQ